jgi:hypothetical protein
MTISGFNSALGMSGVISNFGRRTGSLVTDKHSLNRIGSVSEPNSGAVRVNPTDCELALCKFYPVSELGCRKTLQLGKRKERKEVEINN